MVFGWGKKKTQSLEPEPVGTKEKDIQLSEIKSIIDEIHSIRTKTIIAEVKSHRKKIEPQLSYILKIVKELERDNLKVDDIDKHLEILVIRGKKQVIDIIKKEAAEKLPEIKSYHDVESLNASVRQILKRIGDVLGRQSRVIHIFAKKYAGKLKEHLAILNSDRNEIQILIDKYSKINDDISIINEKIHAYNESKKQLVDTEARISDLQNSIDQLNNNEEKLKQSISELKAGNEYSKYLETKKKLDSIPSEKNSIKNSINIQFTKISRPLSRYQYVSSLEKPEKLLLEKLNSDPFDVLNLENKDVMIKILSAVRKGVESSSISVKDFEKSLASIDETIEMLNDFISQISQYNTKKVALEKDLDRFNTNELNQKENSLSKINTDRVDYESKIKKLENENSETKKKLPQLLMDIEIKLQKVSSTKYHVKE